MKTIVSVLLMMCCFASAAQRSTAKKTSKPVPKIILPPKKGIDPAASVISIVIDYNGEKTTILNTQFETWGGTTMPNGTGKAIILSYGASNSKKNDASFNWMFTIPQAEIGNYTIGEKTGDGGPAASLQFSTTAFPKIPMFLCKSGGITISDCPLPGGFVKGTFNVVLEGGVNTDGVIETSPYNVSGNFSILRQ
ncbi:MAG: hypothetical protein JST86_07080 [Bacteroidetes bacterium]|nr:hypothetical protein [Bacteroidota bacterium]